MDKDEKYAKKTVLVKFRQDVPGFGKKGEIKKISASLYLNSFHPKNLVRFIDKAEMLRIKKGAEFKLERATKLSSKLGGNSEEFHMDTNTTPTGVNGELAEVIPSSQVLSFVKEKIKEKFPDLHGKQLEAINIEAIYAYDKGNKIQTGSIVEIKKSGLYAVDLQLHPEVAGRVFLRIGPPVALPHKTTPPTEDNHIETSIDSKEGGK
jgi:ribosomal protein L9